MARALLRSGGEFPVTLCAAPRVCLRDIASIVDPSRGEMVSSVRSQAGQDDRVDVGTPANGWVDRARASRVTRRNTTARATHAFGNRSIRVRGAIKNLRRRQLLVGAPSDGNRRSVYSHRRHTGIAIDGRAVPHLGPWHRRNRVGERRLGSRRFVLLGKGAGEIFGLSAPTYIVKGHI